jgi:anthranilate synthase component 2
MPAPQILAVDNYDSFTFTLVDYLLTLGASVEVVRNDECSVTEILSGKHDGFLISPGPGRPENAGVSVSLAEACIRLSRPLLGICLGHQAIALSCGQIVATVAPMHGKVATIRHDGTGLFAGLPSPFEGTRYHSLAAIDPRAPLIANAWSEDGVVMAMRHRDAPVYGIQYHPESIASHHGHAVLGAFLALTS